MTADAQKKPADIPTSLQESLAQKLSANPKIAALVKSVDEQKAKLAGSEEATQSAKRNSDEQELAPGNPRSLAQMEEVNPRDEGEDPVAYLDRIFG
jgi:hypothetical protein